MVFKVFLVILALYGGWELCELAVKAQSKWCRAVLELFLIVLAVILGHFLRNGVF